MIYLGDDLTDEDALRTPRDGITVKVGEPDETSAPYYLDGPDSVREFLYWLTGVAKAGGQ